MESEKVPSVNFTGLSSFLHEENIVAITKPENNAYIIVRNDASINKKSIMDQHKDINIKWKTGYGPGSSEVEFRLILGYLCCLSLDNSVITIRW